MPSYDGCGFFSVFLAIFLTIFFSVYVPLIMWHTGFPYSCRHSFTDGSTHALVVRTAARLCADTASMDLSLSVVLVLVSCCPDWKSHHCWCQTLPLRRSIVLSTMSLCALVRLGILKLPARF